MPDSGRNEASAQGNAADPEPQLGVGDEVMLPKYGAGRIEEIDEAALRVRFPDGKSRKFKRDFARPASEDVA